MKVPTIDQMMENVTLTATVKVPAQYKFRLAVSLFLIRLAVRILGCRFELESIDRDSAG